MPPLNTSISFPAKGSNKYENLNCVYTTTLFFRVKIIRCCRLDLYNFFANFVPGG